MIFKVGRGHAPRLGAEGRKKGRTPEREGQAGDCYQNPGVCFSSCTSSRRPETYIIVKTAVKAPSTIDFVGYPFFSRNVS